MGDHEPQQERGLAEDIAPSSGTSSLPLLLWCEVLRHVDEDELPLVRIVCKLWLAAGNLVVLSLAPSHAGSTQLQRRIPNVEVLDISSLTQDQATELLGRYCWPRLSDIQLPRGAMEATTTRGATDAWIQMLMEHQQRMSGLRQGSHYARPIQALSCLAPGRLGLAAVQQLQLLESLSITELDPGFVPSNQELQALASLPHLKHLELVGACALVDAHMQALSYAAGLTSLALCDCPNLEDDGMAHLSRLQQLQHLQLTGSFSKASAHSLGALKQLRQLSLLALSITSVHVTSEQLAVLLCGLTSLTKLDISGSDAIDAGVMEAVGALTGLQELGAAGLHPSAMEGLAALAALQQLRCLDLSWNVALRPQQLQVVTALAGLTALDCSWDRCLAAADLSWLSRLSRLQQLEVPRLSLAERPTLAALCSMRSIRVLDMAMHCFRPTTWPYLAQMSQLEELGLRRCEGAALATGFGAVLHLTRLQRLDLSGCLLQDAQLLLLAQLPALRALDVSHCGGVCDGLLHALAHHGALRHLNISRCGRCSPQGLLGLGRSSSLRKVLASAEMLIALPGSEVPWWLRQQSWWDFRRCATMVEAARR